MTMAGPVFSILRSMYGPLPPFVTSVVTDDWLLNSLPSGIVLFGSTNARLVYVPGVSGAKTRTTILRVAGAGPGSWVIVPLSDPPLHVTTPEPSGPLQVNAFGSPIPAVSDASM